MWKDAEPGGNPEGVTGGEGGLLTSASLTPAALLIARIGPSDTPQTRSAPWHWERAFSSRLRAVRRTLLARGAHRARLRFWLPASGRSRTQSLLCGQVSKERAEEKGAVPATPRVSGPPPPRQFSESFRLPWLPETTWPSSRAKENNEGVGGGRG